MCWNIIYIWKKSKYKFYFFHTFKTITWRSRPFVGCLIDRALFLKWHQKSIFSWNTSFNTKANREYTTFFHSIPKLPPISTMEKVLPLFIFRGECCVTTTAVHWPPLPSPWQHPLPIPHPFGHPSRQCLHSVRSGLMDRTLLSVETVGAEGLVYRVRHCCEKWAWKWWSVLGLRSCVSLKIYRVALYMIWFSVFGEWK